MSDTAVILLVLAVIFFATVPYMVHRYNEAQRARKAAADAAAKEKAADATSPKPPAEFQAALGEAIEAGIRALVQQNRIPQAIMAYRAHYGVDALTAKEAIVQIQRDQREDKSESSITRNAAGYIIRLVREGKIDRAIQVYQDSTGSDLRTAQRAIAQIQQGETNQF